MAHERLEIVGIEYCGTFARVAFACGHEVRVAVGGDPISTCPQCAIEAELKEHRGNVDESGSAVLRLRTSDHPAVRQSVSPMLADARAYFVRVPLDDGRTLILEFGAKGRSNLEKLLLESMLTDDRGSFDAIEDRTRDDIDRHGPK